jgi:hypothetical protein
MELSSRLQSQLSLINLSLQNEDQLLAILETCDLDELLSQETLEKARARSKHALVIFLATLATANDHDASRAQFWLDCYQSIHKKALTPAIHQLSKRHILRSILECLAQDTVSPMMDWSKCKGHPADWKHAFELCIDHHRWDLALQLGQALSKKTEYFAHLIELAKSLARRHNLYVPSSGKKQFGVDYDSFASIYKLCVAQCIKVGERELVGSLRQLQASALEMDGKYLQAIELLNSHQNQGPNKSSPLLDLARCHCKNGDLKESLAILDQTLLMIDKLAHLDTSTIDMEQQKKIEADQPGKFNVQGASAALKDLNQILTAKNMKVFLVSGTLLGYARDGQLMAHDKDIDVGIIGWESQFDMCMALQESGLYTVGAEFLQGHQSYYIPIQHNLTGAWIDVFIYHQEGDKLVTGVDFFYGYRQRFAFTPFELDEVEFLGARMYVPRNIDLNLTENYGDWKTPDKSYISHLESPSTMNKGGLEFMMTARLTAINAVLKNDSIKLKKILHLMDQYSDFDGAMSDEIKDRLRVRAGLLAEPLRQELQYA